MEKLIRRVYQNKANGQLLLSFPKKFGFAKGDYIAVTKKGIKPLIMQIYVNEGSPSKQQLLSIPKNTGFKANDAVFVGKVKVG